jgi:hypothetical protein
MKLDVCCLLFFIENMYVVCVRGGSARVWEGVMKEKCEESKKEHFLRFPLSRISRRELDGNFLLLFRIKLSVRWKKFSFSSRRLSLLLAIATRELFILFIFPDVCASWKKRDQKRMEKDRFHILTGNNISTKFSVKCTDFDSIIFDNSIKSIFAKNS